MEMLKLGVTSVHDDAFFNPTPLAESTDAIMAAYRDVGIRARVAIDQPNVVEYEKFPFLSDILPEQIKKAMRAAPVQTGEELLAIYREFIGRWHGAEDGRLLCSVSCSAPQRVTERYLQDLDATLGRNTTCPSTSTFSRRGFSESLARKNMASRWSGTSTMPVVWIRAKW